MDIETKVTADVAKVKLIWLDYRLYIIAGVSLIIGLFIGHIL